MDKKDKIQRIGGKTAGQMGNVTGFCQSGNEVQIQIVGLYWPTIDSNGV